MSTFVRCPGPADDSCGYVFPVHGYEREATCDKCGTTFNPQSNPCLERQHADDYETSNE